MTSESTGVYIHEEYSRFEKEMDFSAESRLKLKVIRDKYLKTTPYNLLNLLCISFAWKYLFCGLEDAPP